MSISSLKKNETQTDIICDIFSKLNSENKFENNYEN